MSTTRSSKPIWCQNYSGSLRTNRVVSQSNPSIFQSAKSMSIHGDSHKYIEDEDNFNRPWEVPNLEGTGLVALDGDIVVPIESESKGSTEKKFSPRKGLDFDQLFGLQRWPEGVVPYRFNESALTTSRSIELSANRRDSDPRVHVSSIFSRLRTRQLLIKYEIIRDC